MQANDSSDAELADKLNTSRVHVSRLRRLICLPSRNLAIAIERVTGIPARDLMFEDRLEAQEKAATP